MSDFSLLYTLFLISSFHVWRWRLGGTFDERKQVLDTETEDFCFHAFSEIQSFDILGMSASPLHSPSHIHVLPHSHQIPSFQDHCIGPSSDVTTPS